MYQLRTTYLIAVALCALTAATFQNCSKVTFSQNPDFGKPVNLCVDVLETTTSNLKVLFMVDASGSTIGTNGTDPDKAFRTGTIQSFIDRFGSKPNFSYAFGMFSNAGKRLNVSVFRPPSLTSTAISPVFRFTKC